MNAIGILKYTAPQLYAVCNEVTEPAIAASIAQQLLKVLEITPNAVAVAANQIGLMYRVVAMKPQTAGVPSVLINPVIVEASVEKAGIEEGCLSFPGLFFDRDRSWKVMVSYQDEELDKHSIELCGHEAVCIQHEIDHLNGKTMLSHLSEEKQRYWMRKSYDKTH